MRPCEQLSADSAPAMSATAEGDFSDATEMFFGNLAPGGYAWIIPKAHCANVGLGTWERFHGNLRSLYDKFLAAREITGGKATGGYVPVLGPIDRTVAGNVLLAGDSAGMVMATNGGGINVSMLAGRIAGQTAADHLLDGVPLAAYERRWRSALGEFHDGFRRHENMDEEMTESLGVFVRSQRITLEQISEFRQDLEGIVTRRAAEAARTGSTTELRRLLAEAAQCAEDGAKRWEEFMRIDRDVHLALARLAGNPLHHFFLETVHTNFHRYHITAFLPRRVSRRSKKRSPATSFTGKETGGCPPVSVILHPP